MIFIWQLFLVCSMLILTQMKLVPKFLMLCSRRKLAEWPSCLWTDLSRKILQPLIHQMLNLSWKNYVLIANTKKPSSTSSARRACVETLRSLLPMNTSVNGRLPVLVLFHGQSFTLFLIYTTFWFRSAGQNRWRLRFWVHTPVPSRFINEIFSETFYRIVWILSWAVRILGSVHPVFIQMNSISSSFKVEARYIVVEISTLVFSVRYSTTINIQRQFYWCIPESSTWMGPKIYS